MAKKKLQVAPPASRRARRLEVLREEVDDLDSEKPESMTDEEKQRLEEIRDQIDDMLARWQDARDGVEPDDDEG